MVAIIYNFQVPGQGDFSNTDFTGSNATTQYYYVDSQTKECLSTSGGQIQIDQGCDSASMKCKGQDCLKSATLSADSMFFSISGYNNPVGLATTSAVPTDGKTIDKLQFIMVVPADQSVGQPVETIVSAINGKQYLLFHGQGQFLSADGTSLVTDVTQAFEFTCTGDCTKNFETNGGFINIYPYGYFVLYENADLSGANSSTSNTIQGLDASGDAVNYSPSDLVGKSFLLETASGSCLSADESKVVDCPASTDDSSVFVFQCIDGTCWDNSGFTLDQGGNILFINQTFMLYQLSGSVTGTSSTGNGKATSSIGKTKVTATTTSSTETTFFSSSSTNTPASAANTPSTQVLVEKPDWTDQNQVDISSLTGSYFLADLDGNCLTTDKKTTKTCPTDAKSNSKFFIVDCSKKGCLDSYNIDPDVFYITYGDGMYVLYAVPETRANYVPPKKSYSAAPTSSSLATMKVSGYDANGYFVTYIPSMFAGLTFKLQNNQGKCLALDQKSAIACNSPDSSLFLIKCLDYNCFNPYTIENQAIQMAGSSYMLFPSSGKVSDTGIFVTSNAYGVSQSLEASELNAKYFFATADGSKCLSNSIKPIACSSSKDLLIIDCTQGFAKCIASYRKYLKNQYFQVGSDQYGLFKAGIIAGNSLIAYLTDSKATPVTAPMIQGRAFYFITMDGSTTKALLKDKKSNTPVQNAKTSDFYSWTCTNLQCFQDLDIKNSKAVFNGVSYFIIHQSFGKN